MNTLTKKDIAEHRRWAEVGEIESATALWHHFEQKAIELDQQLDSDTSILIRACVILEKYGQDYIAKQVQGVVDEIK